jgi:hypothetical protein
MRLTLGIFALLLPSVAKADSWAKAETIVRASDRGNIIARIEPGAPKFFHGDGHTAHCLLLRFSEKDRGYEPMVEFDLMNRLLPETVLVADDGSFIVTLDDYIDGDATENALAIYSGKGTLLKRWALGDILPEEDIRALWNARLTLEYMSHRLWHGSAVIKMGDTRQVFIPVTEIDPKANVPTSFVTVDLDTLALRPGPGRK